MRVHFLTALVVAVEAVVLPLLDAFENTAVRRTVDLASVFVRETLHIDALVQSGAGESPDSGGLVYYVAIRPQEAENLAAIQAAVSGEPAPLVPISGFKLPDNMPQDLVFFGIRLPAGTKSGTTITLDVAQVYTNVLRPLPAKGRQSDSQMLLYNTTRSHLSVYDTRRSETIIRTVTKNIRDLATNTDFGDEEAQKFVPGKGATLELQSKKDIPAGSSVAMILHYEHPLPLPVVRNLDRETWISHWGDAITFVERYDIQNVGTQLDGPFSRLDFQDAPRDQSTLNLAGVGQIILALPANAQAPYHIDQVGIVSTPRLEYQQDATLFAVQPRFPVMGGWKYNFTVGWDNKLSQFVSITSDGKFSVSVPMVFGPPETYYENVANTLIFPEGATDIELATPGLNTDEETKVYSYLDTTGRPAVTVHSVNLLSEHREMMFTFTYRLPMANAIRKPMTYAGYIFGAFMTALAISKIDLSL